MREIFEMIGMVLEDEAAAMPRAGIILTGGAAQMPGITELGREVLQLPVRVAGPLRVSGLTDTITTPAYSTAVGLLRWGALNVVGDEAARYDTMPGGSVVGRVGGGGGSRRYGRPHEAVAGVGGGRRRRSRSGGVG